MSTRPRVVAIDGTAGSGKSTLACSLASRLALPYVNTGLMYRALTAAALGAGVSPDDEEALVELTRGLRFTIEEGDPPYLKVEGFGPASLVTLEVERTVSAVSRHPKVRTLMRASQRGIGDRLGAVMEGRDIGSIVFADAPVKLYLSASASERAERRAGERTDTADRVGEALRQRDDRDARTTPHVPAAGAVVIDTTELDAAATLEVAVGVVARDAPELVS